MSVSTLAAADTSGKTARDEQALAPPAADRGNTTTTASMPAAGHASPSSNAARAAVLLPKADAPGVDTGSTKGEKQKRSAKVRKKPRRRAQPAKADGKVLSVVAMQDKPPVSAANPGQPLAADPNKEQAPTGRFIWNEPPAGFNDLAETQMSLVDVRFQGQKLASTLAKFAPGWIRFESPREIMDKLPDGVKRDRISEVLRGELPSNAALICTDPPKPGCGRLEPRIAGVIFDRDRFRAELFINPALLPRPSENSGARYMASPDSRFSALQSFAAAYSGGTDRSEQYNVRSFTLLGRDMTRLRAHTGVSDTDGLGVGMLAAEHERKDQLYRAGLYRFAPVPVLGDRPFYGAGYSSTYKARLDLDRIRGSELSVFLPRPSQVDVFREGRLISSQAFSGGNQIVDTSTFPAGAYDLLLRIKESGGTVREERRFFVKSDQVPPKNAPRYVIEAGLLGGIEQNPFPKTDTAPILHAGTTHRLLDEFAIGGDLVLSTETSVLSAELFYLTRYATLSLGGFGALDESAGVQMNINGNFLRFSYGLGGRYSLTDPSPNEISLTGTTAGGYKQAHLNLGYTFSFGPRIGFRGFWRDSELAPYTYSYGPTLYWTFFRKHGMQVSLISDATFSDTESLAMARFRFSYDDASYHFDASAGYRADIGGDAGSSDGPLGSMNGEWRKKEVLDGEVRLGLGAETQPHADVARAGAAYLGPRGQVNAFALQDISNNQDTRYGGNLMFSVIGNSDTLTMGGPNAHGGAIVVAVEGRSKAEFEVLINGQPKGRVSAGETLPFLLPDYKVYSVRLKAVGAPAVAFDTRTRHVSLYPATVKTLRWKVEPIVTLFARIVDADGRPIADAQVQGGVETIYTDGNGYFQVDLAHETQLRVVRSGWDDCSVTFRALPDDREFISGKTLVCRWLTAEKRASGAVTSPASGAAKPARREGDS